MTLRQRLSRLLFGLALGLLPLAALASNCSSNPFTLTNGQTADATQVMANFNNLQNCANNNLAHSGANSDITSLSGLSTPLSVGQGGTGDATLTQNNLLVGAGSGGITFVAPLTDGNVLTVQGGLFKSLVHTAGTVTTVNETANGGLLITNPTTAATLTLSPGNLLIKTVPITADVIVLGDSAASYTAKQSTLASLQTAVSPPNTQLVRSWGLVNSAQACVGCSAGVSVSKSGVGDYVVTTGVSIASTNYSVMITLDGGGASSGDVVCGTKSRNATTFEMTCFGSSSGLAFDTAFNFAVFGNT